MSVRQVSKAKAMALNSSTAADRQEKFREKFSDLVSSSLDAQTELFIKSFIFALGDEWKQVSTISTAFKKYLNDQNESLDLDPVQAADFLQKNGKTRTAVQRKEELEDIDLNRDGRIGLTEYLLLHYKVMVLNEFFKRNEMKPTVDLSDEAIGLTGVGDMLLEELFTMPMGINPEIEEAIEAFMADKKAKEEQMEKLEALAAGEGVKALRAKAEIAQILSKDQTEDNKVEITLKAAQRRASKYSAAEEMEKKQKAEAEQVQQKRRASRAALAQKAAMFSGGSGTVSSPMSTEPKSSE